jgi:hypothetical protein
MLKVMIAGDSFGMPRPFKMTNDIEMHYEDCYPEQLRKMLTAHYKTPNKEEDILLINYCKRANTTRGVLQDLKNPRFGEIYLCQPNVLVLQVGNVDCFERGKHHDEFAPFPDLRGKNPWVNESDFILFTAEIIKGAFLMVPTLESLIIINIPPIHIDNKKKDAATRQRISAYNHRLKMFAGLPKVQMIDIYKTFYKAPESPLASDGIHPNKYGAELIAAAIFNIIIQLR